MYHPVQSLSVLTTFFYTVLLIQPTNNELSAELSEDVVGGLVRRKNMPPAPREINMNTMDRGVSAGEEIEKGREPGNKVLLTAFYRIYNPRKVTSVDKVLKLFDGRDEVLNDKLRRKVRIIVLTYPCFAHSLNRVTHAPLSID
jgi:hypothetical protein